MWVSVRKNPHTQKHMKMDSMNFVRIENIVSRFLANVHEMIDATSQSTFIHQIDQRDVFCHKTDAFLPKLCVSTQKKSRFQTEKLSEIVKNPKLTHRNKLFWCDPSNATKSMRPLFWHMRPFGWNTTEFAVVSEMQTSNFCIGQAILIARSNEMSMLKRNENEERHENGFVNSN